MLNQALYDLENWQVKHGGKLKRADMNELKVIE